MMDKVDAGASAPPPEGRPCARVGRSVYMGLATVAAALLCAWHWLTLPRGSGESGYVAVHAPVLLCALAGFVWASADLNGRRAASEARRWAEFLVAFGLNAGGVWLYFTLMEHLTRSRGIWLD